jgi:hypothetical protein
MTSNQITQAIEETMNKYNELRSEWIKRFGTESGFDKWFTEKFFESIK